MPSAFSLSATPQRHIFSWNFLSSIPNRVFSSFRPIHLVAALALRVQQIHAHIISFALKLYACACACACECGCVCVCEWVFVLHEAFSKLNQRRSKEREQNEKNTHSTLTHFYRIILAKRTKKVSIVVNVSHSTNYVCVCCCTQKRRNFVFFFSLSRYLSGTNFSHNTHPFVNYIC